jgi:virginiamycin B lyase
MLRLLTALATTVILMRHAEKASLTMDNDPPLSEAGVARAKELVQVLAAEKVAAIYTTPYRRTQDTIAPLATALGLKPIVIPTGKAYASDLAARIRTENSGKTVIVVGHSNTTPDVIRQLGIADAPSIADWQYDDLFIVTLAEGAAPQLVRRRYGTVSQDLSTIGIREWPVPWADTRPRDPAVDRSGGVWFVGQTGHYIARLDPASGKFERFDLDDGTGPHNLIVSPDGAIWFAGNRKGYIGRLDARTRKIEKFKMPDTDAGDPHTLVLSRNGDIWFTVQSGSFVGRLEPKNGAIRLVKVPTRGSRPYGIVIDSTGRPWFNEFGRNAIGTIDPATMKLEEYPLPEGTRGRRIAVGNDGGIWYVDYARGLLSRFDPKTHKVDEWPTPGGKGSLPYAMSVDDRGRMWFVETGPQPNRLIGFDPATRRFFAAGSVPSGGSTVRHMIFDAKRRELWFGTDANTIARAAVP